MNNTFSQPAWKLPWEAVATIVEARLLEHLHVPIRCKAVREDEHYWSIQKSKHSFGGKRKKASWHNPGCLLQ